MQRLRVDLKTFLGLSMPIILPCSHKVKLVCRWDFWARNPNLKLNDPYIVLPYYMIIKKYISLNNDNLKINLHTDGCTCIQCGVHIGIANMHLFIGGLKFERI